MITFAALCVATVAVFGWACEAQAAANARRERDEAQAFAGIAERRALAFEARLDEEKAVVDDQRDRLVDQRQVIALLRAENRFATPSGPRAQDRCRTRSAVR